MRDSRTIRFTSLALGCVLVVCSFGAAFAHSPTLERVAELDRAIAETPSRAALYLARGELYHQQRDWQRALSDFDRAALLDPELAGVALERATTLVALGRAAEALYALEEVLMLQPAEPSAWTLRGRALEQLGRSEEAVQAYAAAIDAHPRPGPQLFLDRANAEAAVPRALRAKVLRAKASRAEDVLRGLDEGIAALGPLVTLELPAIDLERELGRFDAALVRLETLSRQSRRRDAWQVLRGEILMQAGRDDEARLLLRAARADLDTLSPKRRGTRASTTLARRIDLALTRLSERAALAARHEPVAAELEGR